jgi:hypothetical protein
MQKWATSKEYLESLLPGYVDNGTDFDPYNLRLVPPTLLPNREFDMSYIKEHNYKPHTFLVDTKQECDVVRKIKSEVCDRDNPGHNWMNDATEGVSKNMCNSVIEYTYDKKNHKKYSDPHLILALTKIRDGYMKCSNERTRFTKGIMYGEYADQCATFEKGYQSPEYRRHDKRIIQERTYADECQDMIRDVTNKHLEEKRIQYKSPKKRVLLKKSPKKVKNKANLIRTFPFEEIETLLSVLKRYKQEGKNLTQLLKGGVEPTFPDTYVLYDELLPIKEFFERTRKDKSKLDVLINRVQHVLDKYREKLGALTLSFENLGAYRRSRRRCIR